VMSTGKILPIDTMAGNVYLYAHASDKTINDTANGGRV